MYLENNIRKQQRADRADRVVRRTSNDVKKLGIRGSGLLFVGARSHISCHRQPIPPAPTHPMLITRLYNR